MFESIGSFVMNSYSLPIMNWWAGHLTFLGVMITVMCLVIAYDVGMACWLIKKYKKFKKECDEA